jgi:hypothetical protein
MIKIRSFILGLASALAVLVTVSVMAADSASTLMPLFTADQATKLMSSFGSAIGHALIPDTDDSYDLGSSSYEWQDIFIDGTATVDAISNSGTLVNTGKITANAGIGIEGTITGQGGAGKSLGWTYVTGANAACTTTCGISAAVFGVDLAGGATAPVLVGPAANTADACICAGAAS